MQYFMIIPQLNHVLKAVSNNFMSGGLIVGGIVCFFSLFAWFIYLFIFQNMYSTLVIKSININL